MVAVVAGNGLGLLGTSLQQLGLSPGGQSSLGQSGASQYVNIATGNLVLQSQDERLVEQGLLAGLVRTYNSLGTSNDFGSQGSWLLGLDRSLGALTGTLDTAGSTITRAGGDGEEGVFSYDATRGLYVASNESGAEDTLQWDAASSTWTYTAGGSRNQEIYSQAGVLTRLTDAESGASYGLTYNGSNQLIAVTASDGEALELGYDASGRISTLSTLEVPPGGGTAVTQSRVTYGYDTLGRLTSVTTDLTPDNSTDSSVFTTAYTYDADSSRIASLTQSDGLTVSYTYAQDAQGNYRIATVTTGNGEAGTQTLSFSYDTVNRTTTVTDAAGRAWVYGYDANGNLTSITSPAVNGQYQVTSYAYTADGHLASVTDALGNQTIYQYDARGNRILERDGDGNTITWTYNADDQVLTRTVYQVADPDGSDPGSAASASTPSTTWYVYDDGSDGLGRAAQLRYVIDADGNVSETQYNSQGQVSLTRRFAGAEYDTSALNENTAPTLSAMNTWVSSQDLTLTTRVDYAYDTAGRLTGKTAWDNVDASGNGVADVGESITTYVYDAQGLLRQQVTERGSDRTVLESSSYSYDGLGRLIGSTDALGNVTTYAYGGGTSSGTLTVTYANGLVHTEVRNSAGELVTVTESASDGSSARTTHYIYDAEGQLRAVQDPSGAITYTFYDEAGRVSGTADAMGAITQYVRDADGRVVETKQYATAVDTTSWLSNGAVSSSTPTDLSAIVPAASPDDRTTLSLYDAAGMHVADVDALGNISTYAYDGAGNLTTTTQYATALSATQLSALQSAPSWSALQGDLSSIASANDRISRVFYDIANRAVATLDAAGYLTTTAYDAAGRIIKTTAYANGLTAAQLAALGNSPSLATVLGDITTSGADQTTRNYYDDAGRLIAQVDADGYLTTTAYDETTHASTTVRYGQALSAAQLAALTGHETLADLSADVAGSPSQTSTQEYDADGRLVSATAVDGTITAYVYDQVGHLLSTTVTPPVNAGTVRTTSATYDVFGDVLTATDAANAATTYTYNVLGQKVLGTDPLGNNTWYFYDADGRLVYTVKGIASGSTQNALGEVTATTYNAFGQAAGTTRYAGRLDLTSLALSTSTSLGAIAAALQAIANPAQDATTTYTYTLAGQIATALHGTVQNGTGYVPAYTNAYTYDAFGELTSTQRQLSQAGQALSASNSTTTSYSYDVRGERIGEVDDAGGLNRTTDVTYDAFGRITSRTDGNGNTTTYSYDALGRQISVSETVQGAVRTSSTSYDAYGRVLAQTDALGNITAYQYSADTRTVVVTTPDGVKLTTTKDAYGETLSVTDSLNNTTSYTYDGDGRLLTRTDALGNVTTDAYDANGDLISSTDANGAVTTYTYDAAGRVLTRTVDAGDSSHLNLTTTYVYDGRGQQVSVTDANGVLTTYSYDADGNVLTVVKDAGTGNLNLTTTYTWDGAGHQLSVTEGAGTTAARTTQYTYDNLGRLTKTQVDPNGLNLTTTYAYDANNNLVARTDADGNITRYVYDEANERVFTIDAAGGVTRWWYDTDGRVTCTCAYATALTATQLSSLGSAPSIAQVAGMVVGNSAADQVSYTVYTNDGHVGYTIDGLGYVTEVRHDADGRVSETLAYANAINVSSLQAQLQQGTAFSSLAAVVSGAGNTDQNAHATLNLYDADGQMRFVVQQDTVNGQLIGIVAEKRYDADGQVLAEVAYGTPLVLSTTQSLSSQLTPSSVAQSLSGATDLHQTSYVYDDAGRLHYTIDPGNYVTERRYDNDGNLVSELRWFTAITVPASLTLASVGAAVAATNASTNSRYTNSTYDHAGRLVSTADNLGTNATYTYDALGQKLSYKNRDGATWTYTYDPAGRLIEQDTPPVATSSYTTGNTLTTATAAIKTRFTYDANGNVLTRTEAYGTPVARTVNYAYDSRGNQIKTTYPGGSYASVTYNALGQAVVNRDVNGHYEYKSYDQDGRVAYEVDGNGYVTAYSYDAYGNQTQVTRYANALNTGAITGWSAGQALSVAQVQQGLVTGGSDRTITTRYDQLNRKVEVDQPGFQFVSSSGVQGGGTASSTTAYAYDAYGNLITTSVLLMPGQPAPDGSPIPGGSTSTQSSGGIPPVWATTYNYYDALNQKTLEVDPQGYITTWAYDAAGAVTRTTQYAKAISTSGLSTSTPPTLPGAGDAASGYDRTSTYTYDSIGRKLSQADAGDYSTNVSGSQHIAAGSSVTSWAYDGENRVTSITVNGAKSTTTYDALGRVLSVTAPARPVLLSNWQSLLIANPTWDLTNAALYETASPVTTFTYDALGNALSSTTATAGAAGGSQITYSHYDALGRVVSETDANGTTYTNTYDAAGNLLTSSYTLTGNSGSSTVTTTYTYDADNQRLSQVTKRSGVSAADSAQYVKYNAFGEIVAKGDSSTTYELNYVYDNAGNLISATDPKTGAQHSYQYDLRGDLVYDTTTVTGGSATVYVESQYDANGRLVSQYTPSSSAATGEAGSAITHTYDRWGNVLSTTDARGYTTTYEYDSQNHLIKQIEPEVMVVGTDGTRTWQTPAKEWYYDINGHLTGVTDENAHTTTNTYDAAGELIATTDAVGAITRNAYDGLGCQVAKQTPITSTTSHMTWQDLDALGRVIQEGDFLLNGSTLAKSIQQQYVLDQNGNRIKVTDAIGNSSYYSYDSQGHLLSSQTPLQHASGVLHTYAYDVNGNKIKETTADGDSETWSYDYFGRVRSHTDLSGAAYTYTYDASSGLLTQETSTWNPTQNDPSYVPTGDHSGSSTESYTYYADGQIQQVTQKVGTVTTTTTSYKYDADGNETDQNTQTVDGAGAVVDTDTQSTYDSHNRLSEVTQTDTSTGAGIVRTVYNYDAAGNRRAVFVQSGYQNGAAIGIGSDSGAPTAPSTLSAVTVQPGTPLNVDVAPSFTDATGFGLSFTATLSNGSALPSWMSITSSGVLMGTAEAPAGSWTVKITGTDYNGNSASSTISVTVPVVNPVFNGGLSNQIAAVGQAFSFTQPLATDANGSAITYVGSLSTGAALPSWLHFDPTTATFSGTPPAGSAGTYTLAVTAYAANGGHTEEAFTFAVAATAPVFNGSIANQTIYPGRSFSFSFPTSLFTTPDGEPLSFTAGTWQMVRDPETGTSYEEDGPLPSWMSFYYSNDLVVFTGTPPGDTAVGTVFNLYVRGRNAEGQGSAEAKFNATVAAYTQPAPVYNGGLTNHTGVIGGSSLNIPLPSGAFTEPDGGALTYTGYVLVPDHTLTYWNSSHTEPLDKDVPAHWAALSTVGLSINATNGTITGVPTTLDYVVSELNNPYQYAHDTSYQIEIVATNAQSETAAGQFTLSNSYAPPALVHQAPNPPAENPGAGWITILDGTNFSDPYGHGLTYSATLSTGAALPSGISGDGYSLDIGTVASGTYSIKITATDGLGRTASMIISLTINNLGPSFSSAPVNLTAVKGSAMSAYTAPAATDPNGDAITYSATGMPSGVSFNASTRTFSGTPSVTGTFTVTYKATDIHGASTSKTFTITVSAPANLPPVYNGGIPATVYLDVSSGSPDTYTFPSTAFSSPAGEALTYSAVQTGTTAEPTYLPFNGSTRTFTANVTKIDHNPSITLTATDTQGRSVSYTFSFYISGVGTINNNTMLVSATPSRETTTSGANTSTLSAASTESATTDATTQSTTTSNIQAYWFTYDADNRVDISGGSLTNGQIVVDDRKGSMEQTYDLAGDVVTELTYSGSDSQTFSYDSRGEMIRSALTDSSMPQYGFGEIRQYDADGRLVADVHTYAPGTTVRVTNADGTFNMNIGGWLSTATTNYYDADGRVIATYDYGRPNVNWDAIWNKIDNGTLDPSTEEAIPMLPLATDAANGTSYGVLQMVSHVAHGDASTGAGGYDAEGNALSYSYTGLNQSTGAWTETDYTVNYLKKDGYLEKATTGTGAGLVTTTDTSYYDAFGRRVDIVQHNANNSPPDDVRAFAYDANGQILEEREGSPTSDGTGITPINPYFADHYAYVNGQQVAHVDEEGTIDVLAGLTDFSNSDQGSSTYVVQDGDTLQSVAQQVYGDSNLWYVLADANGLQSTSSLTAGESLKVPEVKTTDNTANTFKPYNPLEISGSTTPSLPQVPQPPPSAHHCNALAEIVVIAVAVVVTYFTAGAASSYFGSYFVGGAIGGAAGSAASQLAGDALGVSHGFDWGQVFVGAVAGAIGGGLAKTFSAPGSTFASTTGDGIDTAGNAIIGAADYAATYGAEKLVGEPAHFSWAGLIASTVGSMVAGKIGPTNEQAKAGIDGSLESRFESNLVQDVVTREASVALGDNHVQSWKQIGEDVFGNALGNAAIAGIEHENQVAAENQARANLQPATITPYPNMQVDDTRPTIAPVSLVPSDYVQQDGTSVGVDPALVLAANSNSDYYVPDSAPPPGAKTLPEIVVTPDYSYERATPQEEAQYQYNSGMEQEYWHAWIDHTQLQSERLASALADRAYQEQVVASQRQDSLNILEFAGAPVVAAAIPVGIGALPEVAAAWATTGLSAYGVYQGGQDIENGHPIIGGIELVASGLGLTTALPGVVRNIADVFGDLSVPTMGSPRAQAGILDVKAFVPNTAADTDVAAAQASSVRVYPDGSLRTPDGKFASVSGLPAPGTANAQAFADFLSSNGVDVAGTEMEVEGPLGIRRYDIVTNNPDGTLFGIEVKSGGATLTPYQEFSDMYINQFGAAGRGRISGKTITGSVTVYLPPGG